MKKIIIFLILILASGIGFFVFTNKDEWLFKTGIKGFYKLTKEDPLFYSPFLEKEEFEKSIEGLKESEKQLKDVYIENFETIKNIDPQIDYFIPLLKENTLFPFQFLENLVLINQKTKDFLNNPSVELGQELLNVYDNAADFYIQDISSKIKILEEYDKHNESHPNYFLFIGNASSLEIVKNDFLLIRENGYKLKEEIKKRKNCLLEKEDCDALLKTEENASSVSLMESLGSGEFDLKGEKIDFIKSVLPFSHQENKVRGPYKIKSFCWENPGYEHWMYLVYAKRDGIILVMPKLANQNYYWKVNATIPEAKKIDKALSEKGLEFYSQNEATTYECLDLTFYPQLLTLDFLKKKFENGEISEKDLEEKSDLKLLMENQFGLLTPAINTISDQLEIFNLYLAIDKTISPPSYLFPIRTAYSLFSFPYAKSIWRIEKQPQYLILDEKEKPLSRQIGIISLEELKERGYSNEEIKRQSVLDIKSFLLFLLENNP